MTSAPVRTVVNTHHHGDHTFGNSLFPHATLVAHELARAEAIAFGPPRDLPFWDHPDWGDLTRGDLVFNGGTPFLLMGSVAGSIDVLENVVRPLSAATIVPGHGPVFEGAEPIEATLD